MDCRDLTRTDDGWPVIPERDRVPLLRLLEGAALTAGFIRDARNITFDTPHRLMQLSEIASRREAVAHELLLPRAWLYMPVRSHRLDCRNSKPLWRHQGAVKN